MRTQRRNSGDNYWNRQSDRGLFMESPTHSKLFPNDSSSASLMMQPSLPTSSGVGGACVGDGGLGYIEHTVTKFDTLAGVAIKYGVEVADIKRMNCLTTDLQMYARKTVHIPLPGRHPPSPILVNGQGPKKSEMTPPRQRHSDMLHSIKSLKLSSSPRSISPSMDALRDYYGLKPTDQTGPKSPQSSQPPVGLHRKCKSLANGMSERGVIDAGINGGIPVANGIHDSDTWYDRWMRRRRSEIDLQNQTPEMMLKPDTSNTSSAFSTAGGKGLALRPKASSRTASDADSLPNMPPLKLGESVITEASGGVKKSSSSPSFHDMHSNGSSTSIWPTSMLNLTADLQASTAAITRPIFDGLPKPISGRKKAAID